MPEMQEIRDCLIKDFSYTSRRGDSARLTFATEARKAKKA